MALELKQNLKLAQQLIMTPQLQQAIKLLQLSRLELQEMINQELEQNPLLEEQQDDNTLELEPPAELDTVVTLEGELGKPLERTCEITGEGDGRTDFDWDNYLEDYGPLGVSYERHDEEGTPWENMVSKSPTLYDHLMWQLRLSPLNEREMRIGEQIIGNLDPNGYLAATIEEIAEQEAVEPREVEAVLSVVQDFDPPGIAARDLKECLLIQARQLGVCDTVMERIITNHLKDLELKNYKAIAAKLKISVEEVMKVVGIISGMDPKPGSRLGEERAQTIIPDVYVVKSGDDYKVVLNDDGLPRLRISNFYRELMAGMGGGASADTGRKYVKEKVQSATWLIKSIEQRQKTILKVAQSIVGFQKEFLDKGVRHLKPLVLRDVAADVEMHESTVSRVVTNKYIQTPRGVFELKYFFGSGLSSTMGGEAVASKSVKEDIRRLISEEDPAHPLSDSEIAKRLKASGIDIARRTVAKYREMMNILPSARRRRYPLETKNGG